MTIFRSIFRPTVSNTVRSVFPTDLLGDVVSVLKPQNVAVTLVAGADGVLTGFTGAWEPPSDVAENPVLRYETAWVLGDAEPVYQTASGLSSFYLFSGDWTTVRFLVRAVTAEGRSRPVAVAYTEFVLPAINIPRNVEVDVTAADATGTSLLVRWDAPNNVYGRTVKYEAQFNSFGTIEIPAGRTSQTFRHLIPIGSITHFTIKAVASDGSESVDVRVNAADFFRADQPPSIPVNVGVSIAGRPSGRLFFTVDWDAPSDAREPSYQWRLNSRTPVDIDAGTTEASGHNAGVPVSRVEHVEVRSVRGSLMSAWVRVLYEDWTGYIEPAPTNVAVRQIRVQGANTFFEATWEDGRSVDPDRYEVSTNGGAFVHIDGDDPSSEFFVPTDDLASTNNFRVRAVRGSHVSAIVQVDHADWDIPFEPVPVNVVVQIIRVQGVSTFFRLEWGHGADGAPTSYQVRVNNSDTWSTIGGANTQVTLSGITSEFGDNYHVDIRAVRGTLVSEIVEVYYPDWIPIGGDGQAGEETLIFGFTDSQGRGVTDFYNNGIATN